MFGKIMRAGKGSHGQKYKIDVQVTQLENLPPAIKKCRVVWARSAKVQMTDVKDVRGSVAAFKQSLTQVTTIYRDKSGKPEAKEYEFKVQIPGKSSSDALVTVAKATLDMAKYCSDETTTQNAMLPITFKVTGTTTGYLKMVVTTIFLGDSNEDGLTEVSGITGLTSDHGSVREQDLDGFADEEHAKYSKKVKSKRDESGAASGAMGRGASSSKAAEARSGRHRPLPPTAEEDASDLDEDADVSPQPASKLGRKKSQPPEEEEPENPFAKKVSRAAPKKEPPKKEPPPKVWADDDDVSPINSDMSDGESAPVKSRPPSKRREPEESLGDMKTSLFATKKPAGAVTSKSAGAAPSSADTASASGRAPAAAGRAGKAMQPQSPVIEEDEDSMRDDLFAAKPGVKSKGAAAASATAGGSSGVGGKAKPRPLRPSSRPDEDDDEEDDYGPSTSAAPGRAPASKSRLRDAEPAESSSSKAPADGRLGSKASGSAELEQLRRRVAELEETLDKEHREKDNLSHKLQDYKDKIADLEEQLAEADVPELYRQMREMEAKCQAEVKELMERHLAEMEEAEERHRAEIAQLQEAAESSGRRGMSADELRRMESELRGQEAALTARNAKLEAQQAAALAAQRAAEAKLAEADKMIDDSLTVATKHQQENKALQEEVVRLKRQIEDAALWDSNAAVATLATANGGGSGKRSDNDEELEALREKLEELQEDNARLQKMNEAAAQATDNMLDGIRASLEGEHETMELWNDADSPLVQLTMGVQHLRSSYKRAAVDLKEAKARADELARQAAAALARRDGASAGTDAPAKVKPHELLSRIHELTAERDALEGRLSDLAAGSHHAEQEQAALQQQLAGLQERLNGAELAVAAAQHQAVQLQRQVDQLTAEKEAVEQFKSATLADLRRQNDELRTSLRSLSVAASPVQGSWSAHQRAMRSSDDGDVGDTAVSASTPLGMPSALLGSAAARLATATGSTDDNWQEFGSLVAQLKSDRSELREQVTRLEQERFDLELRFKTLEEEVEATRAAQRQDAHGAQDALEERVAELERERAELQAAAEKQQAEAEAIIKEWSDYADSVVAEKATLEARVQALTSELEAANAAAAAAVRAAADSAPEASVTDTISVHPANEAEVEALRQQIERLEGALSSLRMQVLETQSKPVGAEESASNNSLAAAGFRHRSRDASDDGDACSSASGRGQQADSADWPPRGWEEECEALRAQNAALEVQVAGLQASLAVATQQLGRASSVGTSGRGASSARSSGAAASGAEQQLEELRGRLAQAMQEKAALESSVLLLRSELERAPLVPPIGESGGRSSTGRLSETAEVAREAADGLPFLRQQVVDLEAQVAQLHNDRSVLSATVAGLRSEVARLQEDKGDAEATVSRLSAEMEELAEALDASTSENERLSVEIISLRDQVEQLEGQARGSQGTRRSSEGDRLASGSETDKPDLRESLQQAPLQQEHQQLLARAVSAERQLADAHSAAHALVRQVSGASSGGGFDEGMDRHMPVASDGQLGVAHTLLSLRDKVMELQRQSEFQRVDRELSLGGAPAYPGTAASASEADAQLMKARARIDELEQLLENAEIENQHLTEQLEEVLKGGSRQGPGSVGSVADECQSSGYDGPAAGPTGSSNPYSYGHAATLTLSAFEQRLAMAEARRDEFKASLDESANENRRLRSEVARLEQQLATSSYDPDSSNAEGLRTQVPARGRNGRAGSEADDSKLQRSQQRVEELEAANRKLEAICEDLEEKAHAAHERAERLQLQYQDSQTRIRELEAQLQTSAGQVTALQQRMEDMAANGRQSGASKDKVADLEARISRLARDKASLEDQLADERAARQELEETLKDKLDQAGDDEAAETVAAFEVKYSRLKERYKALEESSQEEIDELQDQLSDAQAKISELQRQIKQLQNQVPPVRGGGAFSGAAAEEVSKLRNENESLVQQLVAKTMLLAEMSESEITIKRELARMREVNMRLAQKATTLEAQAAMAQAASNGSGRAADKAEKPAKGKK